MTNEAYEQERSLYLKFLEKPILEQEDLERITDFLRAIGLKDSQQHVDSDYYAWLCDVGERWQRLLSGGFKESTIDVKREILRTIPAPNLILPPDPLAQGIKPYLQQKAYFLAEARRQQKVFELLERIRWLSEWLPSTQEEILQDWNQSRVILALDMIEGRIILTKDRQADLDIFNELQYCFLEEIKKTKAYFLWLGRGKAEKTPREWFFDACDSLSTALRNKHLKTDVDQAPAIKQYLNKLVSPEGRDLRSSLVHWKAYVLHRYTGDPNMSENWQQAQAYFDRYYSLLMDTMNGKPGVELFKMLTAPNEQEKIMISGLEFVFPTYFCQFT